MTEEDVAMAHKQFNVKRYKVVHQAREDLRARRRRAEMQAKQDDPFHRLHQTPLELVRVFRVHICLYAETICSQQTPACPNLAHMDTFLPRCVQTLVSGKIRPIENA